MIPGDMGNLKVKILSIKAFEIEFSVLSYQLSVFLVEITDNYELITENFIYSLLQGSPFAFSKIFMI